MQAPLRCSYHCSARRSLLRRSRLGSPIQKWARYSTTSDFTSSTDTQNDATPDENLDKGLKRLSFRRRKHDDADSALREPHSKPVAPSLAAKGPLLYTRFRDIAAIPSRGGLAFAKDWHPGRRDLIFNGHLDPVLLRDMCACELCVDPASGQKNFCTTDIPRSIRISERKDLPDRQGSLISWSEDIPGFPADHVTKVLREDLMDNLFWKVSGRNRPKSSWKREQMQAAVLTVDYDAYLHDLQTYRAVLTALRDHGLVFVRNVPEAEDSVVNIAQKIGPLRNSFYGSTWDVKSVPQAKNVAYTSGDLGFHMDLLYMKDPPRLQFLHCLRSSADGGSSLFSDSYQAIEDMHREGTINLLYDAKKMTNFHYVKDGKKYRHSKRFIESLAELSRVKGPLTPYLDAVNWSPPFQGPFDDKEVLKKPASQEWYQLASTFRKHIESPDQVFERKLANGECVIFDNRRILHARTAFKPGDAGKERWLKGCYVDADPYESELNVQGI